MQRVGIHAERRCQPRRDPRRPVQSGFAFRPREFEVVHYAIEDDALAA